MPEDRESGSYWWHLLAWFAMESALGSALRAIASWSRD